MKYCPKCGFRTVDDSMFFCPHEDKPIRLLDSIQEESIDKSESWTIPLCDHPSYRGRMGLDKIELRPYERVISRRKYGDMCKACGHIITRDEDQVKCPICGHIHSIEYLVVQTYSPEKRELRKNLTKDELIVQLKEIAQHEVDVPRELHRNAMCYSIAPPHEDYVRCEECGNVIRISSNYLNNNDSLARIVQSINELGYDAKVMGLCKECAEKRGIEPMLLFRGPRLGKYDNGQYFHLFAFKTKDKSEYTYSITNDTLDYLVLEAFLENKTTFEYDEKIIMVKDELPIIQMMSGISPVASDADSEELKQQLLDIAKERESLKEKDQQRKKEMEEEMKRMKEEFVDNKTDISSFQSKALEEIEEMMKAIAEHRSRNDEVTLI